jgi:hypothetical protein
MKASGLMSMIDLPCLHAPQKSLTSTRTVRPVVLLVMIAVFGVIPNRNHPAAA